MRKGEYTMKKFMEPEMKIDTFEIEDIITTSPEEVVDPDQGEII